MIDNAHGATTQKNGNVTNFGKFCPKKLTIKRSGRGSESSTLIIEINPNESQKLPDLAFCYHWFRVFSDQANRSKLVKHSVSEPQ